MKEGLNSENPFDDQVNLNIQKFTISHSEIRAKNNSKLTNDFKNKLKGPENDLKNYNKLQKYNKIKSQLEEIYEKFVKVQRGKCTLYEQREKSAKFFLNLEKKKALPGQIHKLISVNQEVIDQNKIESQLQLFYNNLFKSNCTKS